MSRATLRQIMRGLMAAYGLYPSEAADYIRTARPEIDR